MSVARALDARARKHSYFLFGPRGVGKSTLIREVFGPNACVFNLLNTTLDMRLLANPGELEALIDAQGEKHLVIIDEVQKVPALLDEVHRLIEEQDPHATKSAGIEAMPYTKFFELLWADGFS